MITPAVAIRQQVKRFGGYEVFTKYWWSRQRSLKQIPSASVKGRGGLAPHKCSKKTPPFADAERSDVVVNDKLIEYEPGLNDVHIVFAFKADETPIGQVEHLSP